MDHRSFRDGEESLSLLGLGIMRMPYAREGHRFIDEKKGLEMVDYAIENGINYFDTAYNYHGCTSEAFIGGALARRSRDKFHLATKMPIWMLNSRREMEAIFEEQLQKCRVEYFDFYLIHNFSSKNIEKEESLRLYEFLRLKKEEGRIRRLGFSMHDTTEVFRSVADKYDWDFVQLQINYMDWEGQDAKGKYEYATSKGLPVVVMEPVRGGALATLCERSIEIFKNVAPWASAASWAIRFAASLPNVLVVLSGMSNLDQIRDNIETLSPLIPLGEPDYAVIKSAFAAYRLSAPIPCTACRYCMDCPSGVDIPNLFGLYNNHHKRGKNVFLGIDYRVLGENRQAERCTHCGRCAKLCPQGLDIPALIDKISVFVSENALDDVKLLRPEEGVKIIERTP
ncbi:MAG: aldo/keto reductase [Synergistaceae bacterium]|jgi:predicted aldo/keto reductase-like oxidoreductase|nr:aldo/keto reductase [Synergistaceae bacterium]